MKPYASLLLIYLLILNLAAFAVCGIDKRRAKKDKWRVPEKTLFLLSGLGGALGFLLGMRCFHHKTKHLHFLILIPLFLFLWIGILVFLQIRFSFFF